MNVLIVHAHPEPKSFNRALTELACQTLEDQGNVVQVSDLHAMEFDPVSDRKNFTTCKNPDYLKLQAEELYAFEHDGFAPEIKSEMEKVLWCDLLIFQFPIFWFSLPAVLKGWVDRVFAMGFAYGGGRIYEIGVFRGKRAMLSLTTGGPESSFQAGGKYGEINRILYPIQHGIFAFVGMDVYPPYVAYAVARAGDDGRQAYLNQFRQRLLTLDQTPFIQFD